jgi:hypothetical protein
MEFYVNKICDEALTKDVEYGYDVVGLFSKCEHEGRGSFCGWYASEYYLDTKLYAYYVAGGTGIYAPEKRVSDIVVLEQPIEYDEVQIGSCVWTKVIKAKNIDDAINKFKNAKWSR